MKIHIGWLLVIIIVSALAGAQIEKMKAKFESIGQATLASGTLASLSQALALERAEKGRYPDSISELQVPSKGGDFSEDILRQTTYLRTENGFIAFVGAPRVVYVHPGISPHFK